MPLTVLDTTVLSNFASVRRPDLVRVAVGASAVTVRAVLEELTAGEALGLVPACDWAWLTAVELQDVEREAATTFTRQVHRAEAECLAIAQSRAGVLCTDDLAARRLARSCGVPVSGTLGLLLLLTADHQLKVRDADALLAAMIKSGYRCPVQSLTDV